MKSLVGAFVLLSQSANVGSVQLILLEQEPSVFVTVISIGQSTNEGVVLGVETSLSIGVTDIGAKLGPLASSWLGVLAS